MDLYWYPVDPDIRREVVAPVHKAGASKGNS